MLLFKHKIFLLSCIATIACIVMLFIKPIPQDLRYHHFADERMYFSIPNFWNVLSNVPYFIFGGVGIVFLIRTRKHSEIRSTFWACLVFFTGAFLISFGSAYYHAWPDNETLVWDRLPMTVAFMGFFAVIVGEYVNARAGKILLIPLVALGAFSVWYWIYTEHQGRGDLRLYAIVQYLPMILLPLIVILFRKTQRIKYLWCMMLAYLAAKFFEAGDFMLFENIHISGHTLKHFAASLAPLFFLMYLRDKKMAVHENL